MKKSVIKNWRSLTVDDSKVESSISWEFGKSRLNNIIIIIIVEKSEYLCYSAQNSSNKALEKWENFLIALFQQEK